MQQYYEDTRNPDKYISTEKNIPLASGSYKLSLNIQDQDSKKNWHINRDINLEKINIFGPVLPFINNIDSQKEFSVNIVEEIDTVWIRSQVYAQDEKTNQINYKISYKGIYIDSGKVDIQGVGINHLYFIPVSFDKVKHGLHNITLSYSDVNHSISVNYVIVRDIFWTDDLNELVGVMRYLLPDNSEYKKLMDMDNLSKWNYLHNYWKEKDPSPKTSENELLFEFNNRVQFVNKNFSILKPGWQSDRGRIYIIYGEPQHIESHSDEMGYNYQHWFYPSGKQFIFIDRRISGDYSFYREMY